MRNLKMTVMLALLVAATGCVPAMLFQGAQPVGKGKTVIGAGTSGGFAHGEGIDKKRGSGSFGDTTALVRYGFSDSIDGGLEVTAGGARADVKLSLAAGPGLRIAIDPGVEGGYGYEKEDQGGGDYSTAAANVTGADATVIVGYAMRGGGELYVAPRFVYTGEVEKQKQVDPLIGAVNSTSTTWNRRWGAAVGATVPVGKLELVPELGIYASETHGRDAASRSWSALPGIAFRARF